MYNPNIRSSDWNYGGSKWKLSRAKIESFLSCPRCFYLNNKLGLKDISTFPYSLNSTVDKLLKEEFDKARELKQSHHYQTELKFPGIPAQHPQIDEWRENFKGVTYTLPNGIVISGAIDDLWLLTERNEYVVVDYKSTAGETPVDRLDADYHAGYKRQMEIYQWLLKKNNLKMADYGCFLYCTANTQADSFNGVLQFDVRLIPHKIDDSWVEDTIYDALDCLDSEELPAFSKDCRVCPYVSARETLELKFN